MEKKQAEYLDLMNNGTWLLVPPPLHTNVVGCKWVYMLKLKSDGSIDQYKARLVAKGTIKKKVWITLILSVRL